MDILEPYNSDFKDNGKERFKRLGMAKGAVRSKVFVAVNNDELDRIFDTEGVFRD